MNAQRTPPQAARLKKIRKPNSTVKGDIPPGLICPKVADLLAIPLALIYAQVYSSLEWPRLWKTEIVSIIPKTSAPTERSQLRNLSCTPLFSKLLETFVLEQLKSETSLSTDQYGGLKGIGADHFLIGTWQSILEALDDQRAAASVLSIDFEKAFNRMSHSACIEALTKMGASNSVLGLIFAFLSGRTMSVKVG